MTEQQMEICAHAVFIGQHGGGIAVDPELEADCEELLEKGWLRPAEGEEGETGYAITEQGKLALALGELTHGVSEN